MHKTFLSLVPAGVLALALTAPSGPALACGPNSYIGSVCYTAATYCPTGMSQINQPNVTLPVSNYQVLAAVIGSAYGGDGHTTIGLPNLAGRTLAGVGAGPGLGLATLGQYRGTTQQNIASFQMPPHTHAATLGVTFASGPPSVTWVASTSAGAGSIPSAANSVLAAISPATPMWSATLDNPVPLQGVSAAVSGGFTSATVTNAPTGAGQAFDTRPPGAVILACMPLSGYSYPPRP